MSDADLKRWAETWKRTGRELERIRREELARMTDEQAKAAALDLLSMPIPEGLPERKSGLVEQQRLFARLRASR